MGAIPSGLFCFTQSISSKSEKSVNKFQKLHQFPGDFRSVILTQHISTIFL
jgi:hypothetical protein